MTAWDDGRPAEAAVWAPDATSLELSTGGLHVPLAPLARPGWWGPGDGLPDDLDEHDYAYIIDGRGPFPDPRSRRQPAGVHGPSRPFDPGRFSWSDSGWTGRPLAGSVVYELHVGTFTEEGTLDAAAARLDHLVSLGVDMVELLPVNAVNGTWNWGYDGVLWFAVHEEYGGPEAYQRFVDACHRAGLGVIQDVVYNHLGPSGNYLPQFAPYLMDGQSNTWGASVNLDGPRSDEVRAYILDNVEMWFRDFRVDGLRLDAVHALRDSRATHILEEMAVRVDALAAHLGRPLALIAESDLNDPRLIASREAGGYGLDAQWSDDFHHALHVALTGEVSGYYADFASLDALAKVLTRGFFHDGTYSSFRERTHGRPLDLERTPAWRLVVASQNHDQVGNRAAGDRLSQTLDPGRLAIAAAITILSPFTPMLFMGEEWGASTPWQFFTSHPETELGAATAAGRIEEFARMGWERQDVPDPQDPATFARSKLRWAERDEPERARLLDFYRRLIDLRRSTPEITDPRLSQVHVEADDRSRCILIRRGSIAILVNLSDEDAAFDLGGETIMRYPARSDVVTRSEAGTRVAAGSVAILRTAVR